MLGVTCVKFGIVGSPSCAIFVVGVMFGATVPLRESAAFATKKVTMLGIVPMLGVTIGGMWMLLLIRPVLLVGTVWILN